MVDVDVGAHAPAVFAPVATLQTAGQKGSGSACGLSLVSERKACYQSKMQVIALRKLKEFWRLHPQAEIPLKFWYGLATQATWSTPQDVKNDFGSSVDFVGDNRAIFDIAGNKYRLIAHVSYRYKRVLIKFVGTHSEYDRIDPESVT